MQGAVTTPEGRMQGAVTTPEGGCSVQSRTPEGRMQRAADSHWTSDRTQTGRQTGRTRRDSVTVELGVQPKEVDEADEERLGGRAR